MAKIILAGGSGFIGKILAKHFTGKGDEVVVLTRKAGKIAGNTRYVNWDAASLGPWAAELEDSDVLINLTGKSVNCRYNEANKKEILASRLNATNVLGEALALTAAPPRVWINAASATIYRHADDRPQDEFTGELGEGFSAEVCKQWEAAFFKHKISGVRQIGLRIAIVLGKNGGVMPYYLNLAKFGLGGKQGDGKQFFSWIHENDLVAITDFLIAHHELNGIFNVSAPNPVHNHELMRTVRRFVKMPFGLPANRWMLKMGVWLLRTETELILKSRWVLPTRLLNAGYRFKVEYVKRAIALSGSVS